MSHSYFSLVRRPFALTFSLMLSRSSFSRSIFYSEPEPSRTLFLLIILNVRYPQKNCEILSRREEKTTSRVRLTSALTSSKFFFFFAFLRLRFSVFSRWRFFFLLVPRCANPFVPARSLLLCCCHIKTRVSYYTDILYDILFYWYLQGIVYRRWRGGGEEKKEKECN